MSKSPGVSYLNRSDRQATTENHSERAAISTICNEVARDMQEMLQSMFDGIDDSFFELANNARTNNEQNRFFEAMREIRIKRKGIESSFNQELTTLFSSNKVLKQKLEHSKNPNTGFESLSLVQNEDLEQEVAITSMASKARSNFQGPLLQFHARIGKLYGASKLSEISPPLDPQDICESFSRASSDLEVEIKERLIIYKQFDRYVMSNLEHIYENANKSLIRLGIMPNFKTPGIRQKHGPRSETAPKPMTSGNETKEQGLNEAPQDIFPHLQSLLANIKSTSKKYDSNSASYEQGYQPTHIIHTNDLVSMLTDIQKAPAQTNAPTGHAKVIDIRSALKSELHTNSNQTNKTPTFTQIDDDLINLVSMLFEFILDDYNLAPPIQVLISRLQIPILKVVIKDNTFFGSNRHPARKLLNSLARAGIGWSESPDKGRDPLYQKIHQTVHKILDEFDGDITLFDKLNEDFSLFINKENRKAKIVEQRTKEVEVGRIRSKQAQKKVDDILSSRILGARHPIPQIVIDTLKNGWSRVMFLACLRDDQEHQWTHTIKIAEDLIWCLQPLGEHKDRQKWITIVPKLLKDLKSGLDEVSYKRSELDSTLTTIKTELTTSFKNSSFEDLNTTTVGRKISSTSKKQFHTEKTAVQKQLDTKDDTLEKYLARVDKLKNGTWLEFLLLNGNKFRCKLSTNIKEADCYIFVNRMGLKTIEKSRKELAEDLRKNQAVILEQGLMIDRAMNALMSSLRQKANA